MPAASTVKKALSTILNAKPVLPSTSGKAEKKKRKRNRKAKSGDSSSDKHTSVGVSMSSRIQTQEPVFLHRHSKGMRVRHRELLISSIPGSTGFNCQFIIPIQPGLQTSFPWLASIAGQWEQYICHGLAYHYIPIASTTTQGVVLLSPDYDASDSAPITELQAADNVGSVEDSVWKCITCVLEQDGMMALGPRRFVREYNTAGDIKTFDVGIMYVCTNNETTTNTVGKLYVEYDFEFFIPQNDRNSSAILPAQTVVLSRLGGNQSTASGSGANVIFDAFDAGNIFNLAINSSTGVITPPAGCYAFWVYVDLYVNNVTDLDATISIEKNNTATNIVQRQTFYPTGSSPINTVFLFGVLSCSGTDQIAVSITGTSGTATNWQIVGGGQTRMVLQLA